MHRILLLTSSFSEVYSAAARNLRDALEESASSETLIESVDLLQECYGSLVEVVSGMMQPSFQEEKKLPDESNETGFLERNLTALKRVRESLETLIAEMEPQVICVTHPLYNYLLEEMHSSGQKVPAIHLTFVTSIKTVHPMWLKGQSDHYLVATKNACSALEAAHIPGEKIHLMGFPVPTEYRHEAPQSKDFTEGKVTRLLYIVNSGKKKAPDLIAKLLHEFEGKLTIAVGRNMNLRNEILNAIKGFEKRVEVISFTSRLPSLLRSHHLVFAKPTELLVHEAIAARCPMIAYQPDEGIEQEAGEYLREFRSGAIAENQDQLFEWIAVAQVNHRERIKLWRANMLKMNQPDASFRSAEFILDRCSSTNSSNEYWNGKTTFVRPSRASSKRVLLCDLHTHTTFSDGELTTRDLVDFYGQRGFDAMCITDHICDYHKLIGKLCNLTGLVLPYDKAPEYFEAIEKEKERAWSKYQMILMAGLEFNKDALTAKASTHLLGVDLTGPIDPTLSVKDIIHAIHAQGGLSIAAHPHKGKSIWNKNTLYLWEKQEEFAPLIDAWEIGNRDDLYNPVGLKRLPFIANSDFHKPKHIYSWKTTLFCEKDRESIKQCIRLNRDIAITLYRDHHFAGEMTLRDHHPNGAENMIPFPSPRYLQEQVPSEKLRES